MRHALGLVVPLYAEAQRFTEFAEQLVDYVRELPDGSELVFVDDGSSDATVELAEKLVSTEPRARVLRRPHEGKGAAVAAGLRAVTTPYAAFCDIDLSTPLDQLDLVVAAAERADVLAIASRDLSTSRLVRPEGRVREALGRAYNRLLQITVTPGIVDTQCGAKAASRSVWDRLLAHTREAGFAWDAEAVAIAFALDIPVQEVPVAWAYDDRSGIDVAGDGMAMVRATPRIWRRARHAAERVNESGDPERHWWFRSKASYVATAIRRTGGGGGLLVDIGGGDGAVSGRIGWDPGEIVVVEPDASEVGRGRDRRGFPAMQAGGQALPVASGAASVVCALDVLEHMEDPARAVAEAARVLAPGGRLIATVPAYQSLWSEHDVALLHYRRYTDDELAELLRAGGFEVELLTYVFAWLLPPMLLTRRLLRRSGLGTSWTAVDRAVLVPTSIERTIIRRGRIPFGTTVLCVARKGASTR